MKKVLFLLFSAVSVVCYVIAIWLLYAHYTDENAIIAYLLFMQSLALALLSSLLSLGIKSFLKLKFTGFLNTLYKMNSILLILGSLVFLFYFFSNK